MLNRLPDPEDCMPCLTLSPLEPVVLRSLRLASCSLSSLICLSKERTASLARTAILLGDLVILVRLEDAAHGSHNFIRPILIARLDGTNMRHLHVRTCVHVPGRHGGRRALQFVLIS